MMKVLFNCISSLASSESFNCLNCHKPKPSFRCSKCGIAKYCSKECQREDFNSHQASCEVLLSKKSIFPFFQMVFFDLSLALPQTLYILKGNCFSTKSMLRYRNIRFIYYHQGNYTVKKTFQLFEDRVAKANICTYF